MDKIKIIKNEIEKMSLLENSEIFNIIKKSNSNYSKNINGIFIDLKKIDIKIIDNLYNYIIYCKKLKKNMNEFENTKNVIKDSLENDNKANIIEETLIENEWAGLTSSGATRCTIGLLKDKNNIVALFLVQIIVEVEAYFYFQKL